MSGGTSAMSVASTALQVGGTATATVGSYYKAQGERQAYEYQSKVASNNAQIADWQAHDALNRGVIAENNTRRKTAQLRGSQEALMAARGLSLSEGSPLNILTDTQFMGEVDANTVHDNAAKEGWSLRTQAANYRGDSAVLSSRAKSTSPLAAAAGTLLTGAGKVASSWYSRNRGAARTPSYGDQYSLTDPAYGG